jgi:hypothetical protein
MVTMSSKNRKRKRRGDSYQAPPRKGQVAAQSPPIAADTPQRARRPARTKRERPPAPWGSVPLVELVVLLSVVLLIAGFLVSGTKGITMIVTGMTLGMLAGLELSIREHFAGFKSHSTVLAGFPAVLVLGIGFWQEWPRPVNLLAGALVFASAFYLLREAFKRRSGGLGFR